MHDDKERLARVEQVIENVAALMERIEKKLDTHMMHVEEKFLPRTEHYETVRRLEERIKDLEHDVRDLEQKSGKVPAWASAAITLLITLLGAVVTAYFTK